MGTYAFGPRARAAVRLRHLLSVHWVWLAGGFALAFAVPFVLADTLETERSSRSGREPRATTSSRRSSDDGRRPCCWVSRPEVFWL